MNDFFFFNNNNLDIHTIIASNRYLPLKISSRGRDTRVRRFRLSDGKYRKITATRRNRIAAALNRVQTHLLRSNPKRKTFPYQSSFPGFCFIFYGHRIYYSYILIKKEKCEKLEEYRHKQTLLHCVDQTTFLCLKYKILCIRYII